MVSVRLTRFWSISPGLFFALIIRLFQDGRIENDSHRPGSVDYSRMVEMRMILIALAIPPNANDSHSAAPTRGCE